MAKTLDELKAENAAAELAETTKKPEATPIVEDEYVEEVEEEEAGTESTEDLGEGEEEEVLEPWMQTESEDSETVPVSVLAKTRSKLKAKVGERDDEIAQLRKELESLKSGNGQQPQQTGLPPRPTREQFDYDDDAYDAAVDEWQIKRFESLNNSKQQESQVTQQQQALMDRVKQESDKHYQRAEKLVESGAITADAYVQADNAVRQTLEKIYPNNGDQVTDAMIMQLNSVGDGSEKVMYYLGKNPAALKTLSEKLTSDPSNLSAMIYLGTLMSKVTSAPVKKTTSAPKPGTSLKGGESTKVNAAQKKYAAAHKAGNTQQAFTIKREARQAGVDTSNW